MEWTGFAKARRDGLPAGLYRRRQQEKPEPVFVLPHQAPRGSKSIDIRRHGPVYEKRAVV